MSDGCVYMINTYLFAVAFSLMQQSDTIVRVAFSTSLFTIENDFLTIAWIDDVPANISILLDLRSVNVSVPNAVHTLTYRFPQPSRSVLFDPDFSVVLANEDSSWFSRNWKWVVVPTVVGMSTTFLTDNYFRQAQHTRAYAHTSLCK